MEVFNKDGTFLPERESAIKRVSIRFDIVKLDLPYFLRNLMDHWSYWEIVGISSMLLSEYPIISYIQRDAAADAVGASSGTPHLLERLQYKGLARRIFS